MFRQIPQIWVSVVSNAGASWLALEMIAIIGGGEPKSHDFAAIIEGETPPTPDLGILCGGREI